MRAEVRINEVDVSKIFTGQKVEYAGCIFDSLYNAKVESVATLATNKDYKSK
jgi:hypothetical protein